MDSRLINLTDEEYLNGFHKKWNESLLAERERTLSMRFSHELSESSVLAVGRTSAPTRRAIEEKEKGRLRSEKNWNQGA